MLGTIWTAALSIFGVCCCIVLAGIALCLAAILAQVIEATAEFFFQKRD